MQEPLELRREGDELSYRREVTLLDLVDRILDKGVIITGDVTISVAGVDLVYLSLRALLTSVEAAARMQAEAAELSAPRVTGEQ
ncbi:MAG: gas vesicle protein [Actinomycetota bacterium]